MSMMVFTSLVCFIKSQFIRITEKTNILFNFFLLKLEYLIKSLENIMVIIQL